MRIITSSVRADDTGMDRRFSEVPLDPAVDSVPHGGDVPTVHIDNGVRYQGIDGFGVSITEATASLWMNSIGDPQRLIDDMFDPDLGIGISMLRQPIGPSDHVTQEYSFPEKTTDRSSVDFDFSYERDNILPMVKKAYAAASGRLNIIVSAWSAPAWMKRNGSLIGIERRSAVPGFLNASNYGEYANYLAAFVRFYIGQGLPVYGITPVNEPDFANFTWPSMPMTSAQQREFIVDYLAPALSSIRPSPRIMCWDHNFSSYNYPDGQFVRDIYANKQAREVVSGSAWHFYEGEPTTMAKIKRDYPEFGIWVTEASGGEWGYPRWKRAFVHQASMTIEMLRNYAQSVVYWNLALDCDGGPDYYYLLNQGKHSSNRGLVCVDTVTGLYEFMPDYYVLGHFSKFVPLGSVRIHSTDLRSHGIENVSFLTPEGLTVCIILNGNDHDERVRIDTGDQIENILLGACSLTTLEWRKVCKPAVSKRRSVLFCDVDNKAGIVDLQGVEVSVIAKDPYATVLQVIVATSYLQQGMAKLFFHQGAPSGFDASRYEFFALTGQNLRYYNGHPISIIFCDAHGSSCEMVADTLLSYDRWNKVKVPVSDLTIDVSAITQIGVCFDGRDNDMYLIAELAFEYASNPNEGDE